MSAWAQLAIEPEALIGRLRTGGPIPEKLLSTRSVVIHPYSVGQKELEKVQQSFQQTGIDAVAYYELDLLIAGRDVATVMSHYFNRRDVVNLIFMLKDSGGYKVYITGFNTKDTFIEENQMAWYAEDPSLAELLKKVYRSAAGSQERKNFLVNSYPETDLAVNPIAGRRSDFFAIDLKVDKVAVAKTGNEAVDKELQALLASNYPFKYELTEPGKNEKQLRFEGNFYLLCFVRGRASMVREVLGYENKGESAYVSVTYSNGQPQLKNITAETIVYKFYFKHIDSGNVFLGTKWDADTSWQQALKNHLMAFKSELKIN